MMDMHTLAVSICMMIVAVVGGSDGLIWTEESTREGAVIQICLGEEVSLPWQFITDADETVVNVEWYKISEGIETILATYTGGQFFRSPVTHLKLSPLPNAGLHVANLTWADYGTYSVRVKVVRHGGQLWSISREAVISPPDAPVLAGGRLVAQRVRVPVTDNVTGELHMQLKCGAFLALGSRPLSVVWKTPSGHTVPSTERSADSFFLTLSNPVEGGTYSCHLENHTALQACVKNAQSMSSLKRGAFVQLDEVETQLSILGAQAKSLFSRDEDVRSSLTNEVNLLRRDLQQCNAASDSLASKVLELREELSERKKTEQDLQRQVEVLSTSTHDVRSTLALKEAAYTQLAERMGRVTDQLQDVRSSCDELRSELGKTQSKIGHTVSFFTQFSAHRLTIMENTILRFDVVKTNVGGAYHPILGQFIAPVPGTYAFFLHIVISDHDVSGWMNFLIFVNDSGVALTHLKDAVSLSVALELKAGDTVYAFKRDGPGKSIYGADHTTFSGMLVKQK